MKNFSLLFTFLVVASFSVSAQQNAIKLGLGGLLTGTTNLRYERAITDRSSFQLTAAYKFPTKLDFTDLTNGFSIDDASISGFVFIPEYRFYFGQNNAGTIKGFYVAPYVKFHSYGTKTNTAFNYVNPQDEAIPLNPELKLRLSTLGLGAQLGYHWVIGEHFSIDWHFLGLSFDGHRLGFRYSFEEDGLDLKDVARFIRDEYNDNNPERETNISDDDIDQIPINGKQFKFNFPFTTIGFRAGLSIGYAF